MEQLCQHSEGPPFPNAAFDVVIVAASMGGVEALRGLLAALPRDFPAAVVIQTHLNPTRPSYLVDILRQRSALPVAWAEDQAMLCPGTVTVAPPGQHMRVAPSGRLGLTSWEKLGYARPQADQVFESVAASFGERAIGVVLTGYLWDGARGAEAIQHHNGRVLVQNPATAVAPSMPLATLHTGCADFALSLSAIPDALTTLVMVPGAAQFFAVPGGPVQPYREALRLWGR